MSSDSKPAPEHAPAEQGRSAPPPAVPFTRAAALWVALIVGLLVLIVLLIFVAENTVAVQIQFLNLSWNLPLGVAILMGAVAGGLVTAMTAAARIFQLRRAAKKTLTAGRH